MVKLVTIERTKEALAITTADDDHLLNGYIEAASAAIIAYLKRQAAAVIGLNESGELPAGTEAPQIIQVATIMLVGHFYREPDGNEERDFEHGYLPRPVTALLYPLRDPALA